MGEGNVAAEAPTSAMICCAESTPRPGISARRLHRVVAGGEQIGHLLIELGKVILDHAQFFQSEREQPAVDRMPRSTRLEGIAQLL